MDNSESQYKEWMSVAFGGLLFISEILPYISKVKSNGIVQLISESCRNIFKKSDYRLLLNETEHNITSNRSTGDTSINMTSAELNPNKASDVTSLLETNVVSEKLDKIINILETLSNNRMDTSTPSIQYINNYITQSKDTLLETNKIE